ncbi:MAG: DUF58 domain-containing protein [Dermatophilaceae bacterium]
MALRSPRPARHTGAFAAARVALRRRWSAVTQRREGEGEGRYAAFADAARIARELAGRSWVSPLGLSVLGLGLLAWWAGARYGWSELLVVAAAALVLLGACVVLAIGRASVTIHADVDPRRVVVGDPATGRIVVENTGRVPMLPLIVELPVGSSAARFVLPPLGPGRRHEQLFVVPTHRRGVIPVGPARTVQGDPLGLVRRTVDWTEVTELFVHPRTSALESLGAGLLRDLEGSVTEDQSMSDLAFHALREYQPGDDRRYIHWRSSAKAGRLLVRQFLDTRRSHVTVLVDPDPRSYRFGEQTAREITAGRTQPPPDGSLPVVRDLETAISVGASVAVRAHRDEQDVTVVCGRHTVTDGTAQRTLDTLARVEPGQADVVAMAMTAAALAPDTSVVLLATGPGREFVDLQRSAAQFGPEVRTVVVVVDSETGRGIRHAGGLTLLSLDTLASLRVALAAGVGG